QASAREHSSAAGARLLAIGDTPATEAYDAMRALVSRDNEMGVRATAPELLTIPEVLHARGVLGDPERVLYVVQRPSGESLTCALHPAEALPADLAGAHDAAAPPPPLCLQRSPAQTRCATRRAAR